MCIPFPPYALKFSQDTFLLRALPAELSAPYGTLWDSNPHLGLGMSEIKNCCMCLSENDPTETRTQTLEIEGLMCYTSYTIGSGFTVYY